MTEPSEAALETAPDPTDASPPPVLSRTATRVLVACWSLLVVMAVGSRFDGFVDVWVSRIAPALSMPFRWLTGLADFSVAEVVLLGVIVVAMWRAVRAVVLVARGRAPLGRTLARGGVNVVTFSSVVTALFYGLWGMGYARKPLAERLDWDMSSLSPRETGDLLERATEEAVDRVNELYVELHGSADAGRVSDELFDHGGADLGLEEAYRAVAGLLDSAIAGTGAPSKIVGISPLMTKLGISGFYFPWTGEANINRGVPSMQRPHVIAHEKAHQRGVNSEDEANFVGFLACAVADRSHTRYSGWLFAQRQLLTQLLMARPERGRELLARRHPGVQRDVDAIREYWSRHRGRLTKVGTTVNDAFLRANRVEGGIASYRFSVRLLLGWTHQRGGRLDPLER